ncbi:PEP-CTERM sorting domain-containing protein [Planctomycetota bacterium]|nr:PEP-CTERM sorting domain-containing protein [Planctomycetota bacterium]
MGQWNTLDHHEAVMNYEDSDHYAVVTIDDDGRVGYAETIKAYNTSFGHRYYLKQFDGNGDLSGQYTSSLAYLWRQTKLQWVDDNLYFGTETEEGLRKYFRWSDTGIEQTYFHDSRKNNQQEGAAKAIFQTPLGSVRQVYSHNSSAEMYVFRSYEDGSDTVIAYEQGGYNGGNENAIQLEYVLRMPDNGMFDNFHLNKDGSLLMPLRTMYGGGIYNFNGQKLESVITTEDVAEVLNGEITSTVAGTIKPLPFGANDKGDCAFIAFSSSSDKNILASYDLMVKRDGVLTHAARVSQYEGSWSNLVGGPDFRFQDEMVISENGRVGYLGYVHNSFPVRDFELFVWEGDDVIKAAEADQTYVGKDGREFVYLASRFDTYSHWEEEQMELFTDAVGNMVFNSSVEADGEVGHGVLLYDTDGVLSLLVKEGDLFDVDGGEGEDLREIQMIDERSFWLNDDGVLALGLVFTDGSSGVFTMQIPEPSMLGLLGLGGMMLLRRRNA